MDKKKLEKIEEASRQAEMEAGSPNIIDILLDEVNKDPIVLVDEAGKKLTFEQIAVIPYNDVLYCVLKPIEHIDNVADDEAIVFYVDESGEEPVLRVETNEQIAINVFDEYYNLLDEQAANGNK